MKNVALLGFATICVANAAQLTPLEAGYLEYSASSEDLVVLDKNEILRFSMDLNGDGKPEELFSKASLRNGKQGHTWSVFAVSDEGGKMKKTGDVTVDPACIAPSSWKKDPKVRGFYTYNRGNAQEGMLSFYSISRGELKNLEAREIDAEGLEFEQLFSKRINGEIPEPELKRISLAPDNAPAAPAAPAEPSEEPGRVFIASLPIPGVSGPVVLDPATRELAAAVLIESDRRQVHRKQLTIDIQNFKEAPYWSKLLELGKSITDPQLAALLAEPAPDTDQALAVSGAACFRKQDRLAGLILKYSQQVANGPRTNKPRPLDPADAVDDTRALWEAVLLSPLLTKDSHGFISPSICSEALALIGDARSLSLILRARAQLIAGVPALTSENPGVEELRHLAGNTRVTFLSPLARIAKGKPAGLEALMSALRAVEKEYPALLSLRNLAVDLHPTERGVEDYLVEVVFAERSASGEWLWEKSLKGIDRKGRSGRELAVIDAALKNIEAGSR